MIDRIQVIKLSITIGEFYAMKYPANDNVAHSVSFVHQFRTSVFYMYYLRFRGGKIKNVQFLTSNYYPQRRTPSRLRASYSDSTSCRLILTVSLSAARAKSARKREKERRRGRGRIVEASETLIRTVGSFAAIAPPMRGGSTSPYPVSAQLNFSFHSPGTVLSRSPA